MTLLGTIDAPGGFRHKAPYPRHIVPNYRAFNAPEQIQPNTPLNAAPLGFPASPEELAILPDGTPMRIDHAFSWEYPLAAHGLMHNVIANAARGDPYRIDTLLLFMANMAWNSSMDPLVAREMLTRKDERGDYVIPFIAVCDTFQSETVAFADLVLPDTTYLERHDVMSMLDRPISEFDGPVDSVRVPVVEPPPGCRPFQEVIVELASRLKLPAFTTAEGGRKFSGYKDFVVNFQPQPGVGFLMGWRGEDGSGAPAWRAQSEAVGHVRGQQLRLPVPHARRHAVHAQLEPRLSRLRQGQGVAAEERPDPARDLFGLPAELPPRGAGQDAGAPAARPFARAHRHLLRPAAVLVCAAGGPGHGSAGLSAERRHAAAHGDVPLVGFPERLAAADPQPQLPARPSGDGVRRRHRRRRLGLGREPVGEGALHGAAQRSRGAGNGVDVECDRKGQGRLAPGRGRGRIAQGLPAEPPDLERTAGARAARADHEQLRSGHGPGRLVRRAGAHPRGITAGGRRDVAAGGGRAGGAGHARAAATCSRISRGREGANERGGGRTTRRSRSSSRW